MNMGGSASRILPALAALLLVLVVAQGALIGVWWFKDPERARAASPVLRGRQVAQRLGCFACHGAEGMAGIPNPGARIEKVPSWAGGTFMMFNQSPDEIREWILDGLPRRLMREPAALEQRKGQLLSMPAYRGRLGGPELEDLVAYVQSVSGAFRPEDPAAAEGRDLVVGHGCLGCHGPEGRGLLLNPGSFKGCIPPWDSDDYLDLVRSPEEFRAWVRDGEIPRLRDNPMAARFLDNQAVKMPPFRGIIPDADIERIRVYVEWIRARPRPAP